MIVLLALSTGACSGLVIEDWSRTPTATKGVPSGWREQRKDPPERDMTVVAEGDRNVLHLVSTNNSWSITKDMKSGVDVNQTPILEWSWKVIALPNRADSRQDATSDYAAGLCVGWLRFPQAVRSRIICYLWDTVAPVGTIVTSKLNSTITFIVVRSGTADLGKWVNEGRDIQEDFRRVYGVSPDAVGLIAITISSELTRSTAEAWWGAIAFHRRTRP